MLALSIVYVLTPADIAAKVLGYRSQLGSFGFTGLFALGGAPAWVAAWPRVFEIIYGAGWLVLGAWLLTRETLDRRQLVALAAALLMAIPALGPGYGLQYICWFLPLLVLLYDLAERRTRVFLLVLYAVATITYIIAYGLNYLAFGAFLLDLTQNERLLRWSAAISTLKGQTLLGLPLWLLYLYFVAGQAFRTGGEIRRDVQALRRRLPRAVPARPPKLSRRREPRAQEGPPADDGWKVPTVSRFGRCWARGRALPAQRWVGSGHPQAGGGSTG